MAAVMSQNGIPCELYQQSVKPGGDDLYVTQFFITDATRQVHSLTLYHEGDWPSFQLVKATLYPGRLPDPPPTDTGVEVYRRGTAMGASIETWHAGATASALAQDTSATGEAFRRAYASELAKEMQADGIDCRFINTSTGSGESDGLIHVNIRLASRDYLTATYAEIDGRLQLRSTTVGPKGEPGFTIYPIPATPWSNLPTWHQAAEHETQSHPQ